MDIATPHRLPSLATVDGRVLLQCGYNFCFDCGFCDAISGQRRIDDTREINKALLQLTMSWMIAVLNYICPAVCAWMFSPAMTLEAVDKQMRYPIEEEVNRGTVVCNVMSDVRLRYSSDVMKQLRFRFLSESVTLFDISATTGVITTAARIDRDNASVCREREPHCEISLDVVIQPTQFFQIIKIVVEILDINDNTPTFRESKVSLSINEAAVVGSTYIVPNAIDNDGPVYGIQRYELDTVSNRFGVQFTSKLDGSLEVKLVLNSKLDREVEEGYQLKVMACDGGRPVAKTGTLTVDVVILDSNDNKPEFTSPQYRVNISENMPIGSVILKVQAFDRDLGLNGLIGYGFATRTKNLHGGLFGVRNVTGELYIKGIVDHEKASTYQLVVIAQDHGPDVLSSEVTVIVDVEDLNDNAPSVTIRTLSSNAVHVAEISEEAGVNTFVAQVFVFDLDSGLNGRVNCTINEKVFSLVQKSATEYQVFTATLLDRERTERYALTLKCQDGAGVSRVTEKTLTVIVTDVNDNSPIFSRQQYKGSVVENNLIGISVLQLSCYDYDERDNGRIKYVIPGERAAIFHVDQRGVISVHRSIDREIYDSFHFPVFAVDMGSPPRTGSTFVSISVEDTNDELPRFLQQSYVFSVLENEPVGTQVGVVQALDKDGPPYNVFVFAFLSNSQITECFTLDHVTGVVTTQKELDREVTSLYQSVIIVYDEKLTNMSDTATLSISVLDKNDNSPEFIFPSPVNNTISISNRFPMRHSFCQVLARDTDSGRNAELTFTLIPDHRAGNGTFSIDSKTGKLFLSSSQLLHDFITYHLTIRAVDNGNHPKSSSSLLIVNVNASIPVWDVLDPSSSSSADSLLSAYGLVIGVGVVCGCILVLLLLVVAVVAVRQRDRHRDKYNCRMEGLHMLRTTKDTNASCSSPEGTPRKKLQNGGSKPLLSKDGAPAEVSQCEAGAVVYSPLVFLPTVSWAGLLLMLVFDH